MRIKYLLKKHKEKPSVIHIWFVVSVVRWGTTRPRVDAPLLAVLLAVLLSVLLAVLLALEGGSVE